MHLVGRRPMGSVGFLAGVPAVLKEFWWSCLQMAQYNEEFLATETEYVHYLKVDYSDHAPARNRLAAGFLGEWLVMLDTDHQFEPDVVARLVRTAATHGCQVLSGLYQFKTGPHSPVAWHHDEKGSHPMGWWSEDAEVFPLGAAGAGCLYVHRDVFERIQAETGEEPFTRIEGNSEDHSFFKRCRKLEIACWWAPRIEANHLIVRPVTLGDYDSDAVRLSEPIAVEGS